MAVGDIDERRLPFMAAREFLDGCALQSHELLGVIEEALLGSLKQVRGDGAGVELAGEDRTGDTRFVIEQAFADGVRTVVIGVVGDPVKQVALRLRRSQRHGFGLREADLSVTQGRGRLFAETIEGHTAPDGRCAEARLGDKVFQRRPFANQRCECGGLVKRRQVFTLKVLDGGEPEGFILRQSVADFDGHAERRLDVAAFLEQLQGAKPALTADDAEAL